MKIILASKSPRRKEILSRLNIPFIVVESNIKEDEYNKSESPMNYCQRLAEMKAAHVSKKFPENIIIGADTIVLLNNQVLGKPNSEKDAINMLEELSGNTHKVLTGVSIKKGTFIDHTFYSSTNVSFFKLEKSDIINYVHNYNPYDKAGSYGIQDFSGIFVKKISGCYDNIVGFPLSRFYQELKKLGINLLDSISE